MYLPQVCLLRNDEPQFCTVSRSVPRVRHSMPPQWGTFSKLDWLYLLTAKLNFCPVSDSGGPNLNQYSGEGWGAGWGGGQWSRPRHSKGRTRSFDQPPFVILHIFPIISFWGNSRLLQRGRTVTQSGVHKRGTALKSWPPLHFLRLPPLYLCTQIICRLLPDSCSWPGRYLFFCCK